MLHDICSDAKSITSACIGIAIDKGFMRSVHQSINMQVLGEIIKNAANMTIDEFSRKYLFEPLEIDSFNWSVKFENGVDAITLKIFRDSQTSIYYS
jgi:CubicO group peptidase (beta-lactamase class C family)